jgi:iron complex transport system substrate-binding protein
MHRQKLVAFLLALRILCTFGAVPAAAQDKCEAGFRLITHAMGDSCVVEHPQRVVVLDTNELDSVLALDIKPVGSVEAAAGGGFPAYLAKLAAGVEVVGTIAEPNLEAILALKPDLILSSKPRHENIYPQLSAIAPTVFTETLARAIWKEQLQIHAQALNRENELALRLVEYESRIELIRSVIPVQDIKVSIVRFTPTESRIMPRGSFVGSVINEIGFARPEPQANDEFKIVVSQEQINLMDGDVMFLAVFGTDDKTQVTAFTESPLWQTLKVVQNDRVYTVDDDHWFLGIGLLGANRIMDDLLLLLGNYGK